VVERDNDIYCKCWLIGVKKKLKLAFSISGYKFYLYTQLKLLSIKLCRIRRIA
jgi:hypothetical protein